MPARCDGCRHWNAKEGGEYQATVPLGVCDRAHAFWDRSEWDSDRQSRVLRPEASDDMMFVQDGSDYVAVLLTKPEFFCAHFAERSAD